MPKNPRRPAVSASAPHRVAARLRYVRRIASAYLGQRPSQLAFWHEPALTEPTRAALVAFTQAALADAGKASWKRKQYPVMTQNALRHLIAVSPELQTA